MPLDLERIRLLCFDVDGTLHDTDDQFVQRLAGWLSKVRFMLPQGDPLPIARKVVMFTESPANFLYGIPDRLGLDDKLAALGDWLYRQGIGKTAQPYRLIAGVSEMLHRLSARFPLSVVSARGERSTLHFLDHFSIRSLFAVIATAQTCRRTKPHPDPILWAAEQMHVQPSQCLMIGDTSVDILAGKAAGAQTVGVLCGFGERSELERCGADLILPSTADLADILCAD